MKIALVATAKDERPFVLEWGAHHRLAGFGLVIAFQNNSTDGASEPRAPGNGGQCLAMRGQ